MQGELERLAQVDRLDRERVRLQAEAAKLRAALAEAEAAVAAAAGAATEARGLLDQSRAAERTAQRRLDELRQKRASALRVLETGAGNPEAADRQLRACDELIDQAETEMLELLVAQDGVKAGADAAAAKHAAVERALAEARAQLPPRVDVLTADADRAGRDLDAAQAGLPADLRRRYQSLRAAGKWPVAHVRDGSCDACKMAVPPQNVAELRKGRIVECNGCRRWLVLRE